MHKIVMESKTKFYSSFNSEVVGWCDFEPGTHELTNPLTDFNKFKTFSIKQTFITQFKLRYHQQSHK